MKEQTLQHTAYHEAAHAVICLALGGDWLGGVSIRRTEDHLGVVTNSGFEDKLIGFGEDGIPIISCSSYKAEAVQCYAGRAAEAVLLGETVAEAFPSEIEYSGWDEEDRQNAEEALKKIGDVNALAPRYQRLALWMVRRYWRRIELLAAALLDYHELSADEVGILLEDGRDLMEEYKRRFKIAFPQEVNLVPAV